MKISDAIQSVEVARVNLDAATTNLLAVLPVSDIGDGAALRMDVNQGFVSFHIIDSDKDEAILTYEQMKKLKEVLDGTL
jgi:hypothetical protein